MPNLAYWKTCVPCNSIETRVQDEDRLWTCVMCNEGENITGEFNYAAGEYYDAGACQSCNECSVFEPTVQWSTFSTTNSETDKKIQMWEKEYEDALLQWTDPKNNPKSQFLFQSRWRTRTFISKGRCSALGRREFDNVSMSVKGEDFSRDASTRIAWKGQLFGKKKVTGHYAIHYDFLVKNTKRCVLKHCKDHCEKNSYQYSEGCGQDASQADMWVRREKPQNSLIAYETKKLLEINAEAMEENGEAQKWQLMHHGNCVSCTVCKPGEYNGKCNKWEAGVHPRGLCANCLTECQGKDEFLWHPSGVLRACDPLEPQLRGKSEADYACKRCPTWMQKDGHKYAVIGCGNKASFDFHTGTTEAAALSLAALRAKYPTWTAYEDPLIDTRFKPFWALRPYCPGNFFFDETVPLCSFNGETAFALHSDPGMEFGYEPYKVACCTLCNDCDAAAFRVNSKWRRCMGASMEDTQGSRCDSNCQTGAWRKTLAAAEAAGGLPLPKGNCVECSDCG